MNHQPASLYRQALPPILAAELHDHLDRLLAGRRPQSVEVFFRADDVAVPSQRFSAMIKPFLHHDLPLCLAVVPAWLTRVRFQQLLQVTGNRPHLWCWHQHGRLHRNFEPTGKKQEFGPARAYDEQLRQLSLGWKRLEEIMGNSLQPYFTPPWNRCTRDTGLALRELGFAAISRSNGAQPPLGDLLPDFQVNVDLHTRKEETPENCLQGILSDLENAIHSRRLGIMLHHQRMNENADRFLELLICALKRQQALVFKQFATLTPSPRPLSPPSVSSITP